MLRYFLTPWIWDTTGLFPCWRMPAGVIGSVDLRRTQDRARAGGTPQGYLFAVAAQPIEGIELTPSTMHDAWQGAMGFRPQGETPVDLLWDQLTNGADPQEGVLIPTRQMGLDLWLGKQGKVKSEKFKWGVHSHTAKVRDQLQRAFGQVWEATNGADHCCRILDMTCEKYGVTDWKELVPVNLRAHVPGRLPHATTYSDNFTYSNGKLGTVSSGAWTCTQAAGLDQLEVDTNQVKSINFGGFSYGRYNSDLSGSDHSSSVDFVSGSGTIQCGSTARHSSSVIDTCYLGQSRIDTTTANLYSVAAGTTTNIANGTGNTSLPFTCTTTCNGSTISYADGVANLSVTDTAIAGNVRAGICMLDVGTAPRLDTWTASDLGGAAGQPTVKRFGGVRFAHSLGRGVW